jgi:DNA-directed RNA polymerase specialized sigma subunit
MQDPVREKLITDHLPLVRRVSERLHASWREIGLEISDLVACGVIGLVQAADRFDPTRGVRFKTFAEVVIEGAIRDGVGRGRNWFGRRAVGAVIVVHLDDVAPDGWEDWLGQSNENGLPLRALWNGRPLFQPAGDSDLDLRALLGVEIQLLPERERRVIRLCFYEGKKLTEAAQEMRVQPPRASRLRKQALQRLRHAIDKGRKRLPEPAGRKGLAR